MLSIDTEELLRELTDDEKLRIRARAQAQREIAEESGVLTPVRLSNERTPPVDIAWRVNRLLPADSYVLIQAKRKSGKTTLVGNLIRSLTRGEAFLGEFGVRSYSRVGLFDLEMSENKHKQWLDEMGL